MDALDEIIDEGAYRDLLGMLAEGMAGQFPHRFVITSRPMASGDEINLSEVGSAPYALEPFDQDALSHFAQRWFSRTGSTGAWLSERFLAQVRSPGLREVVTVPLLATVAAIVFEQAPDRPLPARRYHLYQAYLRYLFSGRDEAFIHQWPRLQERLTAMPRGAALAEALRDGRLLLAETLAVQWLETGRALADAAADWLRDTAAQVGVPLTIIALDVREIALTVAMTTGLFARADEDIFFLHRSLAEHLAASVYARRLPHPFTSAAEDWLDWLDRAAMSELLDLPHSTLAAYTWSHPDDDLVGWLQRQGTPEYRQVAGQLIAHGARTPPGAVAAFCGDFSNRPGLTGPGSSIAVFAQSMAALVQLLDYPEAIIALGRVTLDDRVPVERRLHAAAALVSAGTSHAGQGMEFFRQVLRDGRMKPRHRIRAAAMVPGLPAELHEPAAAAMREVLSNLRVSNTDRQSALSALGALGPEYKEEAMAGLRMLIADSTRPDINWSEATKALRNLDPSYRAAMPIGWQQLLAEPQPSVFDISRAVDVLSPLGPQHREEVARRLREVIADQKKRYRRKPLRILSSAFPQFFDAYEWRNSAMTLGSLSPQFTEEAVAILRGIYLDAQVSPDIRADAIRDLARLDARYHEEAVAALRAMMTAKKPGWQRATVHLADFESEDRREIASALREVTISRRVRAENRLEAAERLSEFGPQYHEVVAAGCRKVIASWFSDDREEAAQLLSELGPAYSESAERAFRKLSTRRRFNALDRISAIENLIESAPNDIEAPAAALLRMIRSRFIGYFERELAVELLADAAPHHLPEAAEALRKIVSRQRSHSFGGAYKSVSALKSLGQISPQYRQEATHGLLQILMDQHSKSIARELATKALAEFGPTECEMAAGSLRDKFLAGGEQRLARQPRPRGSGRSTASAASTNPVTMIVSPDGKRRLPPFTGTKRHRTQAPTRPPTCWCASTDCGMPAAAIGWASRNLIRLCRGAWLSQ